MRFHALPSPSDADVRTLAERVKRGIVRQLVRCGRFRDDDGALVLSGEDDAAAQAEPLLASCQAACVRSRIALGRRAGQRVRRLGDVADVDADGDSPGTGGRRRRADHEGFSLHADVAMAAHDRERLCRYVARPAIAGERLSELEDGRLAYALRRPWRDGTTGSCSSRWTSSSGSWR